MPIYSAGSATVQIVPDFREGQKAIETWFASQGDLHINVVPDLSQAAVERIRTQLEALQAEIRPDLGAVDTAAVQAQLDNLRGEASVRPDLNATDLAAIQAALGGLNGTAQVRPELSAADMATVQAQLNSFTGHATIKLDVDRSALDKALADATGLAAAGRAGGGGDGGSAAAAAAGAAAGGGDKGGGGGGIGAFLGAAALGPIGAVGAGAAALNPLGGGGLTSHLAIHAIPLIGDMLPAIGALGLVPALITSIGASAITTKLALDGMSTAFKGLSDNATPAQLKAAQQALAAMPPAAREFVTTLAPMQKAIDTQLVRPIQQAFYQGLGPAVKDLATVALPLMQKGMVGVAQSTNQSLLMVVHQLIADTTQFSTIWDNIDKARANSLPVLRNLVQIFVQFATVGSQFLPAMATNMTNLTQRWLDWTNKAAATGELFNIIQRGMDTLHQIITLVTNLGKILFDVFTAAQVPGKNMLQLMIDMTGALANFLKSPPGADALRNIFTALHTETAAIVPLIGDFIQQVILAAGHILHDLQPAITVFFAGLTSIYDALKPVWAALLALVDAVLPPLVKIFDALAPPLVTFAVHIAGLAASIIVSLTPALSWLADFLAKSIVPVIDWLGPALGPIVAGIIAWKNAQNLLNGVMKPINFVIDIAKGAYAAAVGVIEGVTKAWAAAQWLLNAAMDANPIILIIGAVVLLGIAIYELITHWQQVTSFLQDRWNRFVADWKQGWSDIASFFQDRWNNFVHAWQTGWTAVASWFSDRWNAFTTSWNNGWSSITSFFQERWNNFAKVWQDGWNSVTSWFSDHWNAFIKVFQDGWNSITSWFSDRWPRFSALWQAGWTVIGSFFADRWNAFAKVWEDGWNAVTSWFSGRWGSFSQSWQIGWTTVVTFFTDRWNAFAKVWEDGWNAVTSWFAGRWSAFTTSWNNGWTAIGQFFADRWNAFIKAWEDGWNAVTSWFAGRWSAFTTSWNSGWIAIGQFFADRWNAFIKAWEDGWNAVTTWFSGRWSAFTTAWNTGWSAIGQFFSDRWNAFIKTWQDGWNSVTTWFDGRWKAFTTTWNGFWDGVGKKFNDIWNGIKGYALQVWNDLEGIIARPINFVIGTILNNGLFKAWNAVNDFLKLPFHLATLPTIPGFSEGGYTGDVGAFGTGAKEDPAGVVHAGEFVHTQEKTKQWLPLFQLIHEGQLTPSDLGLPGFAGGGFVGSLPGYSVGGVVGGIAGFFSSAADALGSLTNSITSPINDLLSKFGSNNWVQVLAAMPKKLLDGLWGKVSGAVGSAISSLFSVFTSANPGTAYTPFSGSVGGGAARWKSTVDQVLSLLGLPLTADNGVLNMIAHESGGNPNAINLTDSNAAAGHPSQGLLQTIPSTFAANAGPFASLGITNPLANIYAGVVYALHRYGIGMLEAGGLKSASGAYMGYDTGGWLPPGVTNVYNGTGRPELVLNPQQQANLHSMLIGNKSGGGATQPVWQFFLGDREITDVVDARVTHWSATDARNIRSQM